MDVKAIGKRIDDYFNNITPEELLKKCVEYGFEFEDIPNGYSEHRPIDKCNRYPFWIHINYKDKLYTRAIHSRSDELSFILKKDVAPLK